MPSLVSHENRLVFVHVQKTGGSSIAYTLMDLLHPQGAESLVGYPNHLSYEELLLRDGSRINSYTKFMAVRNPWDMAASALRWHQKHGDETKTIEGIAAWLKTPEDLGLDHMDIILRFERLPEDFASLCDRIGIERRPLLHLNTSGSTDYNVHTERSREIIALRFKRTIERFGYQPARSLNHGRNGGR